MVIYNNILKTVYPANKKKSTNSIADLRDELELRRQILSFKKKLKDYMAS